MRILQCSAQEDADGKERKLEGGREEVESCCSAVPEYCAVFVPSHPSFSLKGLTRLGSGDGIRFGEMRVEFSVPLRPSEC